MGRRSTHTREQLRVLIVDAAYRIIEEKGFSGLSARAIARHIDYSPGTIYNIYKNLDDVTLTVEGRVLDALRERLQSIVDDDGAAEDKLLRLAHEYLDFTHAQPKLWNVLFQHHLPEGVDMPDWYREKIEGLMYCLEQAVMPHFPDGCKADCKRAARVLWTGVHGITSLSTTKKLTTVTSEAAALLVDDLVSTYLAGLAARRSE